MREFSTTEVTVAQREALAMRALNAEDLSDEMLEALAAAQMDSRHAVLDALMDD